MCWTTVVAAFCLCILLNACAVARADQEALYPLKLDGKIVGLTHSKPVSAVNPLPDQLSVVVEAGPFVHQVLVQEDGSFHIDFPVPLDSTLQMHVMSSLRTFPEYSLAIPSEMGKSVKITEIGMERRVLKKNQITIAPLFEDTNESRFFEQREAFDIKSLLFHPVVMSVGMMGVMMLMMKNMDPKAMREAQDAMRDLQNAGQAATSSAPAKRK
jgi:hypothetical protein